MDNHTQFKSLHFGGAAQTNRSRNLYTQAPGMKRKYKVIHMHTHTKSHRLSQINYTPHL